MSPAGENVRTYERFDKKAKAFLYFNYDFSKKMDFWDSQQEGVCPTQKLPACSKNVSAEGICFTSFKKLETGENIHLELYLDEKETPIQMEGEVRWSQSVHPGFEEEGEFLFDTGVRLTVVEGKPVPESIYYDEQHHLIWSAALECILGKYKDYARAKKDQNP